MSPPLDDFDPVPTTTVTTTTTATSANTTISPVTTPTPVTATASPAAALRQDEVDAIIRSKRKARQPKACYPCHARKVRCDRQLPCTGCVRRDHAELCSYERPSSRRRAGVVPGVEGQLAEAGTPAAVAGVSPGAVPIGSSSSDAAAVGGNVVMIATDEWLRICERLRAADERDRRDRQQFGEVEDGGVVDGNPGHQQTLDDGFDPANDQSNMNRAAPGVYAPNEFGGGTVHLGSRSVLAYILANPSLSRDAAATLAEGGILPKLGLDNESATYPFVDLWSSDPATFDVDAVCAALPEDELCRTYMQKYRDITSSIYPVLSDINHFETSVELLLRNRAVFPRVQPDRPFGMSLEFIGLFFAILSAGCLATSDPGKHITSQVYICCSYQFLRVNNYLSQPSIEAIQTLLIIGSVLSYNMNPGVSYVVFGMTLRMGLVLGLHVESSQFPPMEQYVRRCLWWSMAWQESHFSLSYDRPTVMAFSQPDIPYGPGSAPGNRSYFETLCQLMSITLEIVRARMLAPPQHTAPAQLASIQRYEDRVSRILADTTVHLRDSRACTFLSQHLEHLALKLHSSYLLSELYRPVLKPDHGGMATASAFSDPREAAELQEKCIDALAATVQAYVDLHSVEPAAAISWVAMQRAISSAFLLAVCVNPRNTERYIPGLLRQLEMVMAARASAEGVGLEGSDSSGADDMTWQPQSQWTKPLTKSLRTLRKLNSVLDAQIRINGSGRDRSERSTPNPGSAFHSFNPTPTMSPDSSSSSDWTMPKLMDRVSEYIHPPLCAPSAPTLITISDPAQILGIHPIAHSPATSSSKMTLSTLQPDQKISRQSGVPPESGGSDLVAAPDSSTSSRTGSDTGADTDAGATTARTSISTETNAGTGTPEARVLIIVTGGTICMQRTEPDGAFEPVPDFLGRAMAPTPAFNDTSIPEPDPLEIAVGRRVERGGSVSEQGSSEPAQSRRMVRSLRTPVSAYGSRVRYAVFEFETLLDSSSIDAEGWSQIAETILWNYQLFDGFVILHGTDSLAYTCSALSFMLANLGKPVILTGSQAPMLELQNDATDNVLGSLVIAGHFMIPEVCLYFDHKLFRGNRTTKVSASAFAAFDSPNTPPLAVTTAMRTVVQWDRVHKPTSIEHFRIQTNLDTTHVACLRIFPGIKPDMVDAVLRLDGLRGLVLETFGAGNAPGGRDDAMVKVLAQAIRRGIVIVSVTQCLSGAVAPVYAPGMTLFRAGVVAGQDMTSEAALTKLAYLLALPGATPASVARDMSRSLRGELTEQSSPMFRHPPDHPSDGLLSERVRALVAMGYAVAKGEVRIVEDLLHGGGWEWLLHEPDYAGNTPLHMAATSPSLPILHLLLTQGASVHVRNRVGRTPLFLAAQAGLPDHVELLLRSGAHLHADERRVAELHAQRGGVSPKSGSDGSDERAWALALGDGQGVQGM